MRNKNIVTAACSFIMKSETFFAKQI